MVNTGYRSVRCLEPASPIKPDKDGRQGIGQPVEHGFLREREVTSGISEPIVIFAVRGFDPRLKRDRDRGVGTAFQSMWHLWYGGSRGGSEPVRDRYEPVFEPEDFRVIGDEIRLRAEMVVEGMRVVRDHRQHEAQPERKRQIRQGPAKTCASPGVPLVTVFTGQPRCRITDQRKDGVRRARQQGLGVRPDQVLWRVRRISHPPAPLPPPAVPPPMEMPDLAAPAGHEGGLYRRAACFRDMSKPN